jgi:hypothetical protein
MPIDPPIADPPQTAGEHQSPWRLTDLEQAYLALLTVSSLQTVFGILDPPAKIVPTHVVLGVVLFALSWFLVSAPRLVLLLVVIALATESAVVVAQRDILENSIEGLLWPRRLTTIAVFAYFLGKSILATSPFALHPRARSLRISASLAATIFGASAAWRAAQPEALPLSRLTDPSASFSADFPANAQATVNSTLSAIGFVKMQSWKASRRNQTYSMLVLTLESESECPNESRCMEDFILKMMEHGGFQIVQTRPVQVSGQRGTEWTALGNHNGIRSESIMRFVRKGTRGYLVNVSYKQNAAPPDAATVLNSLQIW